MSALRGASRRWGPAYQAKKNARVSRNAYRCAHCGKIFGSKEINIDHIIPVVDPSGMDNSWDAIIDRMFPEVEGYQMLCEKDHDIKTAAENTMRKATKSILKNSF